MVWWALTCSSLPWQVLEAPGKMKDLWVTFHSLLLVRELMELSSLVIFQS